MLSITHHLSLVTQTTQQLVTAVNQSLLPWIGWTIHHLFERQLGYFYYVQLIAYVLDTPFRLVSILVGIITERLMALALLIYKSGNHALFVFDRNLLRFEHVSQWISRCENSRALLYNRLLKWPGPLAMFLKRSFIHPLYRSYLVELSPYHLSQWDNHLSVEERQSMYDCLSDAFISQTIQYAFSNNFDGIIIRKKSNSQSPELTNFITITHPKIPRKTAITFRSLAKNHASLLQWPSTVYTPSLAVHIFPKSKLQGGNKTSSSPYKTARGSFKKCEYSVCPEPKGHNNTEYVFLTENQWLSIEKSAGRSLSRVFSSFLKKQSGQGDGQSQFTQHQDQQCILAHEKYSPDFSNPQTILQMMRQVVDQLQIIHDATATGHLDIKHGNIVCTVLEDQKPQFTVIDYPDTIFMDDSGTCKRNYRSKRISFTPHLTCMHPGHTLLNKNSPTSGLNHHSKLCDLSLDDFIDALPESKIPNLLDKISKFEACYPKRVFLEGSMHHDLWSLLYIGLLMSKHLDQPHASIFSEAISNKMFDMLDKYCAFMSCHDSSHVKNLQHFEKDLGRISDSVNLVCQAIDDQLRLLSIAPKTRLIQPETRIS